jgi:hypothetical protein
MGEIMNSSTLWDSRKFRILIYDTVIALIMFIVSRFFGPEVQEAVTELIAILQLPILTVIGGIAVEDAAQKRSGN